MKRISLLLFIIPAFLFSCDEVEEANTIEFDTTLSLDIPVAVVAPTAMLEKSTQEDFMFEQSATSSLSEMENIQDYLSKVKTIEINDIEIVINNLGAGEEIKKIDISVEGIGVLATIMNVSATNNVHSPSVDNAKLTQAATILNSTKAITVMVSGTTNSAPMDFTVNMDFDCHIEANAL